MEKKDIMDYVLNTPTNTNPAILSRMLENYGGGTGKITYPVIIVEESQITSLEPPIFVPTVEQQAIIENEENQIVVFDGSSVDLPTASTVRFSNGPEEDEIYFSTMSSDGWVNAILFIGFRYSKEEKTVEMVDHLIPSKDYVDDKIVGVPTITVTPSQGVDPPMEDPPEDTFFFIPTQDQLEICKNTEYINILIDGRQIGMDHPCYFTRDFTLSTANTYYFSAVHVEPELAIFFTVMYTNFEDTDYIIFTQRTIDFTN